MAKAIGHTRWVFPDGDLPDKGTKPPYGHESLVILNASNEPADVKLTLYFSDRDPVENLTLRIEAKRVRCVRMDAPVGDQGFKVPLGQYALVVESSVPVVAQFGRMDVQQPNLAYYTVMGFPA